jgi:hypothetical protein
MVFYADNDQYVSVFKKKVSVLAKKRKYAVIVQVTINKVCRKASALQWLYLVILNFTHYFVV